MIQKIIFDKIIFDYGGVLVSKSRTQIVANTLNLNQSQQQLLKDRMQQEDIKQAALGKQVKNYVSSQITTLFPHLKPTDVFDAFYFASTPDTDMLRLTKRLALNYNIKLISNSLPEYSEYILHNQYHLFDSIYLSDRYAARKPIDLFKKILEGDKQIFCKSIYIDDDPQNLTVPKNNGAQTILFTSNKDLLEQLTRFQVL